MVSQWRRTEKTSTRRNIDVNRPGWSWCLAFIVAGRMVTPSSGAKSTATIHDTSSDTAMTTNSVKVYSPAALLLRPIGMKPATVTSVPVSIGKAVEV